MAQNIKKFIVLADLAALIADSDADWETKYDLIFSNHISVAIRQLDIAFDWCDPDTSEEEDVKAFVSAVKTRADELKKEIVRQYE